MKTCTFCLVTKNITEFYKNGKESRCNPCFNRFVTLNAYPNQDAPRGGKSSEKRRATQARYRERHREKVRALQREYVHNNKAKVLARTRKYQLSKRNATPPWMTNGHWLAIEAIYIQAEKLTDDTGMKHEVDHIIPINGLNVNGLHVPWNLQIILQFDNRSKFNKY